MMIAPNLIKKILISFFLISLLSCSNYKFVYDESSTDSLIKNKTAFIVSGDDITTIELILNIKSKQSNNPEFDLIIQSNKNEFDLVTKTNQVATVTSLQYTLEYTLKLAETGCVIIKKDILTESSYNNKSSGYSFGSDLSIIKLGEELIEENINIFFNSLAERKQNFSCNN